SLAFPEGDKELLTSGNDGLAFRWDLASGNLNQEINLRPAYLPGEPRLRPVVDLHVDGIMAVWRRNPAEVFDVETGADLFCVPPPSSPVAPVFATAAVDGKKIAMFSHQAEKKKNGSCAVWDLMTRRKIIEFDTPPYAPGNRPGASFSPDG